MPLLDINPLDDGPTMRTAAAPKIPGLDEALSTNPLVARHQSDTRTFQTQGLANREGQRREDAALNPPEIPSLELHEATQDPEGRVTRHYAPKAINEPQFDSFTTPQEIMERMPASESGMAQQLSRHDISIANLSRLPAPTKMRIINAAQVFNPEWKASDYATRQASRKSFTSGPLGNTKTAINTAIHHLDTVLSKADEMNNTTVPGLNAVVNPIAREIGTKGGKATREFDVAAQLLASELAKIVKGGTPTQMEVREQMQNFSHNLDPDTLRGNIQSAVELLSGKLDGLRTQYQDAYQAPNKFGFIDEDSRKILKKHGFDPDHIDPRSEGSTAAPVAGTPPAPQTPEAKPKTVRQNGVIYTLGEDGQYH